VFRRKDAPIGRWIQRAKSGVGRRVFVASAIVICDVDSTCGMGIALGHRTAI
jgi:hypothetical protein